MFLRDYLIGIAGSLTAAAISAAIAYAAYRFLSRDSKRLVRTLTARGGIWYAAWQPAGEGFSPWHVEQIRFKTVFLRTGVVVRTHAPDEEEAPFVWSGQLQFLDDSRTVYGPWRSWKMPFYAGLLYLQIKHSDFLSGHFTSWTAESNPWIGRCIVSKTKAKLKAELRKEIADQVIYDSLTCLIEGLEGRHATGQALALDHEETAPGSR